MRTENGFPVFMPFLAALSKRSIYHLHFIGIGGAGMCGLAEIVHGLGYKVTGSDQQDSPTLQRLSDVGIFVQVGHHADYCRGADLVIISSAITAENPELHYAREQQLPVILRGQLLGELMRYHYGISISGSHGKTTTSSLISSIFLEANEDPTIAIGGKLVQINSNARLGGGSHFIAEADESDASMLYQHPVVAVVTNIDADHMATYQNDMQNLYQTFSRFLQPIPFYGAVFLGIDDIGVQTLLPKITVPYLTFGLTDQADVYADHIRQKGWQTHFTVHYRHEISFSVILNLPGQHNVQNALAAIGVALFCRIEPRIIQHALRHFAGVGRRMQEYGDFAYLGGRVSLVDDYGHHPREIAASLKTIRDVWSTRRLVLVYQLHRYTRTRDLLEEFVSALSGADQVILLDIYPASEVPIAGITTQLVAEKIGKKAHYVPQVTDVLAYLPQVLQPEDVLLIMGAGNIGNLPKQILEFFYE